MNNGNKASYRSGGVGAGSGVGKASGVNREISRREAATSQPTAQAGQTGKPIEAQGEVGVARSSVDPERREHSGEARGGTRTHATQSSEGPGDGWSDEDNLFDQITTPPKVRKLQQALYRKAKAEPKYRFWSLSGDLCRPDVIELAMSAIARNGGAARRGRSNSRCVSAQRRGMVTMARRTPARVKEQNLQTQPRAAGLHPKG